VKWRGTRQKLADHALALRTDLPVRAGLRALAARRGGRFTAYDGNLAGLAHGARRIRRLVDGSGEVSATALERWADCPFRYFLDRVLAAEPTEAPEERWTIDALEKGSLVHDVLEAFFRELAKAARPRDGEPYTAEDVELLERLAAARRHRARADLGGDPQAGSCRPAYIPRGRHHVAADPASDADLL
jgi:hypothetical protein